MNFCYGVMSKNVVDTIIEYSLKNTDKEFYFIPSRRQVDYDHGYVNNWTTKTFSEYVRLLNPKIKLERDHGGPGQGDIDDDGYESLKEDCKYFNIIHIDPWKKYKDLDLGIQWTIDMINYCYNLNPNIEYEIATEEGIRPFTVDELEILINTLKKKLDVDVYLKIKFLVIQCGTKLKEGENTGLFDSDKLKLMLELANKYNLIAKEHNGDWVPNNIIKEKQNIGLKYINIAPEFGEIETKTILENIDKDSLEYKQIFNLCIESGRWKKWVDQDFNVNENKEKIIQISCHYIFSLQSFKEIKTKIEKIDEKIKFNINLKLNSLFGIFYKRDCCVFCNSTNLTNLLEKDLYSSLSLCLKTNINKSYFMPYNVFVCDNCETVQNKYLGDLSIVYETNHLDDFGTTKIKKHSMFCDFIINNKEINGIIEVGACHDVLPRKILEKYNTNYTIIEPSFTGDKTDLCIIPDYLENINLDEISANTIIMSDVFEHFYEPLNIIKKIQKSLNIKYIYLNHPDFDYAVKNNIEVFLNCEHTFIVEHQFLFKIFELYGFKLTNKFNYENFSLFLEFTRIDSSLSDLNFKNLNTVSNVKNHFDININTVKKINNYMQKNVQNSYYIWPTSIHAISLFTYGLDYTKLTGILDNSPNKIGKYLYAYNLLCSSFEKILETKDDNIIVFIANAGNYINELDLTRSKVKIIRINNL